MRHVVEHQARRPQSGMRCAWPQPAPAGSQVWRNTASVGSASDTTPGSPHSRQHSQRVDLAGRLDDPRQHQLAKHLVALGCLLEPQDLVGAAQRIPQMRSSATTDRQRPGSDRPDIPDPVRSARQPTARPQRPSTPPAQPHREPNRDARSSATRAEHDHTICTAVAPDDVFTVRTYAIRAPYDPILVFNSDRITPKVAAQRPVRSRTPRN